MTVGPTQSAPDGAPVQATGRVAFHPVAEGSRSERQAPVLLGEDGRTYLLHLIGENPFEQPTLRRLAGRRVSVSGNFRAGVVRVEASQLTLDEAGG